MPFDADEVREEVSVSTGWAQMASIKNDSQYERMNGLLLLTLLF